MGECKRCGHCCRWAYFEFNVSIKLTPLMKLRGAEVVGDKLLRVPLMCSQLDPETNLCRDYENRPQECKDFPRSGDVIPKECKYEEMVL